MSDFFPDGYEIPNSTSGYMKFDKGDNKFRILGKPVIGQECWVEVDGKSRPVRKSRDAKISPKNADTLRHFWAMVVWNFNQEKIQILVITQKTIQKAIKALKEDKEWGSPLKYNINIQRQGDNKETTTYLVMPGSKKDLDKNIYDLLSKSNIDLEQLYSTEENPYGGNPFQSIEDIGKIKKELDDELDLDEIIENQSK